jgi:hypothetical protein
VPSITFDPDFKLQRIEECAFAWSGLTRIQRPVSIEMLCKFCFSTSKSLASVTFQSNSKLERIEESAFACSGLIAIQTPVLVEMVCKECFPNWSSLASITIESDSKLREAAADSFARSSRLHVISYPLSLFKRSRMVVWRDHRGPSSSITDEK